MRPEEIMNWLRSCACQKYGCAHKQAADLIEHLYIEVNSQRFWAELMAGNNCYCASDDTGTHTVGICIPCVYRKKMEQNEEIE